MIGTLVAPFSPLCLPNQTIRNRGFGSYAAHQNASLFQRVLVGGYQLRKGQFFESPDDVVSQMKPDNCPVCIAQGFAIANRLGQLEHSKRH